MTADPLPPSASPKKPTERPAGAMSARLPLTLDAGAKQLGIALTPEQRDRLEQFAQLLRRWNRTHNLTAIDSDASLLTHHLLDSLAVLPAIRRLLSGRAEHVLDVGSGAGLPGIVLAIAWPSLAVTLVDAVQKKCAFMTQVRLELGLAQIEVVHSRIEVLQRSPFPLIVSRAFASLAEFTHLTRHLLADDGRWLAMKGRVPESEMNALPRDIAVMGIEPLKVPGLDAERHVVEMRLTR